MRGTLVYDVLNQVTTDALFTPKSVGERACASQLIKNLPKSSVIFMDRGYPAFWLFDQLQSSGHDFVVRAKRDSNSVIQKFWDSSHTEIFIDLKPSRRFNLHSESIPVRLIKKKDKKGEPMVIITSIIDPSVNKDEILILYDKRWYAEENYKILKSKLNVEHISSRSFHGVYCDIYAKALILSFAQWVAIPLHDAVKHKMKNKKNSYKLNFSKYLSHLNRSFVFLIHSRSLFKEMNHFIEIVLKYYIPIRFGRTFERGKRVRIPEYFINYRPLS